MTLYNTQLLPLIMYCIIIWGNATLIHRKKLAVLPKRASKIILKVEPRTRSEIVYSETKAFKLEDPFGMQILKFMFKHQKKLLPPVLMIFLLFKQMSHQEKNY